MAFWYKIKYFSVISVILTVINQAIVNVILTVINQAIVNVILTVINQAIVSVSAALKVSSNHIIITHFRIGVLIFN